MENMQYLVFYKGEAFWTKWYESENHFVEGMVIFDLGNDRFTTDGKTWKPIEEDHL